MKFSALEPAAFTLRRRHLTAYAWLNVPGKPALLFLYIVLPIICGLIAAAIIRNHPITETRHARIRARVQRKLNQNGAAAPRSAPSAAATWAPP